MGTFRIVLLLLVTLLLAGCGEGERPRDASREAPAETEPTPQERSEGKATSAAFTLTPELQGCMEAAGFTQDAPPTGGLAAWRHPSGGRVVVASGPDVTSGIAAEIGTAEPAQVEGDVVVAAADEQADAARDCLDA